MKGMSYKKFWLTMFISFIIMYTVMFLNIDNASHYHTSLTRIYMALLMVAPMAVVMMAMMGTMYPNKNTNMAIIFGGIVVFFLSLIALRTQTPIGDIQYMKAMIPHHSSAIMVSKHAKITDPEVKRLSEQIIAAQEREIAEMDAMITRLKNSQ
ncbi:DUF305 domain-containing protein [Flaviaesturariibacter flavus]|uniref:DUF305 domain-containing protein n=2 Tax=Flaviaesturariibacter flavus TaxID=2502780 RepID=A0A4R1B412_9BACT|nr:DUF305 domain-containing protein [Flaviaesturariibacter flavus]